MRVLYLVHDLNDAAVTRRVAMLVEGGAMVDLAGFWRGEAPPAAVSGVPAIGLARSFDAKLGARAMAVARQLMGAGTLARRFAAPDVIMARNLEMLALATAMAGRFTPRPVIVYECLDIHRMMLGAGGKGQLIRRIERQLLGLIDLLIVSSPAFVENYFKPVQAYGGPWRLIENKARAGRTAATLARPGGPPWRIGWFGMLRCAKSLRLLSNLVRASDGRIQVLVAGKPALTEIPDFEAVISGTPGMTYAGPYKAEDLSQLYSQVHFAWAIDYFEEGLNSAWLLPNRLYEGSGHGAVPIALSTVQTGRWLADHGAGLLIADPAAELPALLAAMDNKQMAKLRGKVAAIPPRSVLFGREDSRALVQALAEAGHD